MNRAVLRRVGRVFGRITPADIADAIGAVLVLAAPVLLLWIVASLGLVEPTTAIVGGR